MQDKAYQLLQHLESLAVLAQPRPRVLLQPGHIAAAPGVGTARQITSAPLGCYREPGLASKGFSYPLSRRLKFQLKQNPATDLFKTFISV